MKNPGGVVVKVILGMLALLGNSVHCAAQDSKPVVHPASASPVITVTVTDLYRGKHGHHAEVVIAQAVGFPNDTCDVITTFDVVKKYEERQTWSNVSQRLDIVVDGTPYPATFRDIGFYPLGLNLACIDFDSPLLHAQLKIPVLPLDLYASGDPSSLAYDDKELAKSNPGTPFLNDEGEVSSVLVATGNGQLEFASADDVRTFLKVAANVAPRPTLSHRPLSLT
jgi:hypothetical protein